ncbi:MAG: gliding motility-associated C-terminal domain-containing protein, partial [Bacteroidales bacterium]|nr:gliding motility-associated C-terminal domain-containing protein [Bacteroidales bacterium]
TVNEAGMYTYQWKETNWQCVDSANVSINFYEQLQNVDAGEKIVKLFYTDKHTFNGNYTNPDNQAEVVSVWAKISENGTAEILNPNEKTTDVINIFDDKNQGLLFTWTVQKGVCPQFIDTTTIKLEEIFTPTGFSPNGDGINDRLKFLGLENAKSNELIIYNRWGTEVFRKKDFSNTEGWDGKNNRGKDLPEDTYFYILKVINKKDLEDNYKGYIVIKKY